MKPPTRFPSLVAEAPLLRIDGGIVRIGTSRVSLDVLVAQYDSGMSPEEFVRAYEGVSLADVHAALGYFLRHQDEVRNYVQSRGSQAQSLRTEIESERAGITRSDLTARRTAEELASAPTGE